MDIEDIIGNLFGIDDGSIKLKIDISIPMSQKEEKPSSHSLVDYDHVYGCGDKSLSSLFDDMSCDKEPKTPNMECNEEEDGDEDEPGSDPTGLR